MESENFDDETGEGKPVSNRPLQILVQVLIFMIYVLFFVYVMFL